MDTSREEQADIYRMAMPELRLPDGKPDDDRDGGLDERDVSGTVPPSIKNRERAKYA